MPDRDDVNHVYIDKIRLHWMSLNCFECHWHSMNVNVYRCDECIRWVCEPRKDGHTWNQPFRSWTGLSGSSEVQPVPIKPEPVTIRIREDPRPLPRSCRYDVFILWETHKLITERPPVILWVSQDNGHYGMALGRDTKPVRDHAGTMFSFYGKPINWQWYPPPSFYGYNQ